MPNMRTITRWSAALCMGACLLAGALLFSGCQTAPPESFAHIPVEAVAPALTDPGAPAGGHPGAPPREDMGIDRIRVGDSLTITFSDLPPPMLPPFEERVKEDGTITLIENQVFVAAGKTRGELEQEIRKKYVPEIFQRMTVTVRPQKDTQFYYVGGEVRAPGRQVYIGRMTVTKAIKSAGDFTDYANKRKVTLTRVSGKQETVNVVKALRDPRLDPEVYPGDSIHVSRSWL